jgi:hypothetical protein
MLSFITLRVSSSRVLHFGQPVPNIFISINQ